VDWRTRGSGSTGSRQTESGGGTTAHRRNRGGGSRRFPRGQQHRRAAEGPAPPRNCRALSTRIEGLRAAWIAGTLGASPSTASLLPSYIIVVGPRADSAALPRRSGKSVMSRTRFLSTRQRAGRSLEIRALPRLSIKTGRRKRTYANWSVPERLPTADSSEVAKNAGEGCRRGGPLSAGDWTSRRRGSDRYKARN